MAGDNVRLVLSRPALRILFLGNFTQALGLQLFAPILPIYLAARGVSSFLVGVTIAAGISGYGLAQFPSGWLADRFDRRKTAIWGLGIYSLLFLVYLLRIPPELLPLVRFIHAGIAGVYSVACVAMLGDFTPAEQRGRVFGMWQATTRAGFLIGPLIGGLIATFDLAADFIVCCVAYLVATAVMTRLPRSRRSVDRTTAPDDRPVATRATTPKVARSVLPMVAIAAAGDYCAGLFTAVWSIWLISTGASPWQIGLSFCAFAAPAVLLSAHFGSYYDRGDARRVLMLSLAGLICVAPLAAFGGHVALLTLFAAVVGLLSTPARPIVFAAVSRMFGGTSRVGIAQGSLQGGLMGAQFIAALVGGTLLAVSPLATFASMSLVGVGSLIFSARQGPAMVRSQSDE